MVFIVHTRHACTTKLTQLCQTNQKTTTTQTISYTHKIAYNPPQQRTEYVQLFRDNISYRTSNRGEH